MNLNLEWGTEWGTWWTDYVLKVDDICNKCCHPCRGKNYPYVYCRTDIDIKFDYTHGRVQDAIVLLRGLPSELLEDYLREERRTPVDLKAVILDELKRRGEYDKPEDNMRL